MSFFLPTLCKKRVSEITPPLLRKMGIRGILLDVDNTLSTHGSQQPLPAALSWTRELSGLGIKLMIISNNHKERVEPFAAQFSLPFCTMPKSPCLRAFQRPRKNWEFQKKNCWWWGIRYLPTFWARTFPVSAVSCWNRLNWKKDFFSG